MLKTSFLNLILFVGFVSLSNAQSFDAHWVEVPNSVFGGRDTPGVAYDTALNRVIMFGGGKWDNTAGAVSTFFCTNQLAEFKAGLWRQIDLTDSPTNSIRPRVWPNVCYDPVQDRIILAGGDDLPNFYTDTRALKGDALTLLNNTMPQGSSGRAMFFNTKRSNVSYIDAFGQIFELAGSSWQSLGAASPNWGTESHELFGFAASYSSDTAKLVVFSGETDFPTQPWVLTQDTYVFDANTNAWTKMTVASKPDSRYYAGIVYHPVRKKHVLVGGNAYGGDPMKDVWEYDDTANTWNQLRIENPIGFRGQKLVYDLSAQKIRSFGGFTDGWQLSTKVYELQFTNGAASLTVK